MILNNEKGWGFSTCIILDGIGYDFYGSSWAKLEKARKHLDDATLTYRKMMLEEEIGGVRQLSGGVVYHLTNTVCFLNHDYFKPGGKHQLEEMLTTFSS